MEKNLEEEASHERSRKPSILPHLYPFLPNHPLTQHSRNSGNEVVSACHLKPQDSQPSGNGSSTVTELIACEEAEAAAAKALAQINQHLFISTYKTDFGGTVHGVSLSGTNANVCEPDPTPAKQSALQHTSMQHTSMRQHYQEPPLIPSLRNKTTRHGYTARSLASGAVPTAASDMYRDKEYTSSHYTSDYTDPSCR